jgi:hypothetical protein
VFTLMLASEIKWRLSRGASEKPGGASNKPALPPRPSDSFSYPKAASIFVQIRFIPFWVNVSKTYLSLLVCFSGTRALPFVLIALMFECRLCGKNSVQHLWVLFQPIGIVGAPPYRRTSIIKPSGNTRIAYAFVTFTLPYFSELHKKRES